MQLNRHPTIDRSAIVVALIVLAAAVPSVSLTYAVRDDLLHLSLSRSADWTVFFPQIRYVTSVLVAGLHQVWGGTVSDLWFFRFLHAVLLAVFAVLISLVLRRRGIGPYEAAALSIVVSVGPGTVALLKYSSAYTAPIAAILALLAYVVAERALTSERQVRRTQYLTVSAGLLVVGLSTYQPYAMFVFVFVACDLLSSDSDLRTRLKRFVGFVAVFAVGAGAYFIFGRLVSLALSLEELSRAGLTTRPFLSLIYFVAEPLRDALNQFILVPHAPSIWDLENVFLSLQWRYLWPYLTAAAVGMTLLMGLLSIFRSREGILWKSALPLLPTAALLGLAYTPSLVVDRFLTSYREQAALYAVIAVFLFFILVHLTDGRPKTVSRSIMAVWVALAVGLTTYYSYHYSLRPLSDEWLYVKHAVTSGMSTDPNRIVAVVSDTEIERREDLVRERREQCFPFTKDYGRLTSLIANGASLQIQQAVREAGRIPNDVRIQTWSWERWLARDEEGTQALSIDFRVMYPCELAY